MLFPNSQCRNGWLHDFKIIGQYEQGIQERCFKCGLKKFFRVINGQANNKDYLSWHMRQALPKQHLKFQREYGI